MDIGNVLLAFTPSQNRNTDGVIWCYSDEDGNDGNALPGCEWNFFHAGEQHSGERGGQFIITSPLFYPRIGKR